MNLSVCGIDCAACPFTVEKNCPGCRARQGRPFWGECGLYDCAAEKAVPHCGACGAFPCKKLKEAHEAENPDGNGIEIENLRKLGGLPQ